MTQEMPLDALLEVLAPEVTPSEQETLEWLALETSNLRELVRLALIDEVSAE